MIYRIILLLLCAGMLSACDNQQQTSTEKTDDSATGNTATQSPTTETASSSESAKANQLFEDIFEQAVSRSPVFQTILGRPENKDKWDDISDEFAQQGLQLSKQSLAKLKQLDTSKLDESARLSYELMEQALQNEIDDFKWRLYNYPVNQMFGTHADVPDLLINQHRVATLKDAQDYITRLNNVPTFFSQLIDGIKARTAIGIIPPKFVFPHVIRDSQNIIKGAPFDDQADSTLLADFKGKISALKETNSIDESTHQQLLSDATNALLNSVQPAYQNLIAHLQEVEKQAATDDGIWKWKDGDQFYNVALQRTTTTNLSAEQIHQIGLDEVKRIHNEMREIMKKVDFKGGLHEFMQFMRSSEQFYYPNTAEGKAAYLKKAKQIINDMKDRLDELFITKPKADIQVKAVEAFREQSTGKAFYQMPSEDGSRPGLYYANLFDMQAMPTYQMEALAYHEGIPGHHMQIAIAQELQDIPKFRKFGRYTAYTEGWGLYSEMVPKEIGLYSDPYSDFGRLSMELWRACRLVVDTGIHAKKWTRQQGIDYYSDNTPNAISDGVKMVERHIVMPSQATAYKIGMLKIVELREKAKQGLGEEFDIREFHDEVLKYGPLPLNVLERKVDAWVAQKQQAKAA